MTDLRDLARKLLTAYTELISKYPASMERIETSLRVISYFIPSGGTDNSCILSELLYSCSGLLSMLHDHILRSQRGISLPHVPTRQLLSWLMVVEYVEVFLELTSANVGGAKTRWIVVGCIQLCKCAVRLYMLLVHRAGLQISPPVVPLDRTKVRHDVTQQDSIGTESSTFTLRRTGRSIRRLASAPATMGRRSWNVPNDAKSPQNSGSNDPQPTELDPSSMLGECLHIARPLVHSSLYVLGAASWLPWITSVSVDLSSLVLLSGQKRLNGAEEEELRRRTVLVFLYLLRSPFYDRFSKMKIIFLLTMVQRKVPLVKIIIKPLLEYIPIWQRIYFYVWMN